MLLAKPGLSDDARQQAASRIKRASRDMGRLVTDLLEYTRTRLGAGIPIERATCDLGPVCEAALEDIRAGNPEQPFVQQLSGDLTLQVGNRGDPIPADALQSIFEPLVRAPSAHSELHERSKTSLGLGLFIVREIVLAHGGSITVESSLEAGSAFTIRLPRKPPQESLAAVQ